MKKTLRIIFAIILIILILLIAGTYLFNYNVKPLQIFIVDLDDTVFKEDFENFNQIPDDCCNILPGEPSIYANKSEISHDGNYSLNLTSNNHCSCIKISFIDFIKNDIYLMNIKYIGTNPRFCNWVVPNNKCMTEKNFKGSQDWFDGYSLLYYSNNSYSSTFFLYADSDGTKPVTNLYDSLSVNRLLEISYQEVLESEQFEKEFSQASGLPPESNQYIILTRSDNLVKNAEFLSSADEGFSYYLIQGIPQITLKFPWTELIIIILLIVIVIRLLFKKGEYELKKLHHQEPKNNIRETFNH